MGKARKQTTTDDGKLIDMCVRFCGTLGMSDGYFDADPGPNSDYSGDLAQKHYLRACSMLDRIGRTSATTWAGLNSKARVGALFAEPKYMDGHEDTHAFFRSFAEDVKALTVPAVHQEHVARNATADAALAALESELNIRAQTEEAAAQALGAVQAELHVWRGSNPSQDEKAQRAKEAEIGLTEAAQFHKQAFEELEALREKARTIRPRTLAGAACKARIATTLDNETLAVAALDDVIALHAESLE